MGKYIGSEIKKAVLSKMTRIYLICAALLCVIANAAVVGFRMIYGTNEGTYAYNILEYATWCFIIPYYSCIIISHIVFGKDYPNPHIKDMYTDKLNRTQIYISKLVSAIVLALVFMVYTFAVLVIVTTLFQIKDGTMSAYQVTDFLKKAVCAIPLWAAGIGLGMMFLFMFEKKIKAYICFFAVTVVFERIIMVLAAEPLKIAPFILIRKVVITQHFSLLPYPADPARNIPFTIALGIIYMIIFTVIGIGVYNRKKIK